MTVILLHQWSDVHQIKIVYPLLRVETCLDHNANEMGQLILFIFLIFSSQNDQNELGQLTFFIFLIFNSNHDANEIDELILNQMLCRYLHSNILKPLMFFNI